MALSWTERARQDLVDIFRYIAEDDRRSAERWVSRLMERAEVIAGSPRGGRIVPELRRDDVREVFLRTYRIVYRIAGDDIRVLTVFEGHRRLRRAYIEEDLE